jgi:hypothetical protein
MKARCIQGRGWFEKRVGSDVTVGLSTTLGHARYTRFSPPNVGGASNVAYPIWLEVLSFRTLDLAGSIPDSRVQLTDRSLKPAIPNARFTPVTEGGSSATDRADL